MSILYVLQILLYLLYRNRQAHAWSIGEKDLQPNCRDGRASQRGDAHGTLCLDGTVEITSKISQWTCQGFILFSLIHNYFSHHRWFLTTYYLFCNLQQRTFSARHGKVEVDKTKCFCINLKYMLVVVRHDGQFNFSLRPPRPRHPYLPQAPNISNTLCRICPLHLQHCFFSTSSTTISPHTIPCFLVVKCTPPTFLHTALTHLTIDIHIRSLSCFVLLTSL